MTNIAAIVAAIYIVEGGTRARVPFGIESVRVDSFAEAQRVCRNTVVNNLGRWRQRGAPGCFYDWLGTVYVGEANPRGQRNWKANMKRRLHPDGCDCR
jgi:hypothetical protein